MPATSTATATVRYEEVKTWPTLPAGVQMGEAAGVAVDTIGHVLGFHRPGRGFDTAATETLRDPAVLEIDFKRQWIGVKDAPTTGRVFNAVHDLAVGPDGSIYVAETRTRRVVKLRPVTAP